MPDDTAQVEIPQRALFKAVEVCELVKVQPYVLRSWESEFPELGVAKTSGGARVYRRSDVEQVLRIKRMLLVDGLTLAGVRRKLEGESAPVATEEPAFDEMIGEKVRERLATIKTGLQSILELLASSGGEAFHLAPTELTPAVRPRPTPVPRNGPEPDGAAEAGAGSKAAASPRRKRSA